MKNEAEWAPPAQLQALTTWQLSKISTIATRLTGQQMPLTARSDSAVLAALDEYGAMSQADLGRYLGLDRNNVNGIAQRLESGGFIQRATDREDRRLTIVTITPAGQAHRSELFRRAAAVQVELLRALTPDERKTLTSLLQKVLTGHPTAPA